MDYLCLEIRRISVNGLNLKGKGVSSFSKNKVVCASVSIHGSNQSAKQETPIDKNGGTDPMFNFHEQFFNINTNDVNLAQQFVVMKLKEKGFLCGKDIGQAHVSIGELLKNYVDTTGENHVSRLLMTPGGKVKGVLDIKYAFRKLTPYTGPGDGVGPGDGAVGAYQYPTALESGGGDSPASAAQPQGSSKFANVSAGIGAGAAVLNALVGFIANCF